MTTVVLGDPGYFSPIAFVTSGRVAGSGELESLVNAGLSQTRSTDSVRVPQLGTEIPSTATGSWRVFPDGRMETTATLKPGLTWHDGAPLTSRDLVFSVTVAKDKDTGLRLEAGSDVIDSVEIVDDRSVVVKWKSPFITADEVFASFARIIPEHLLGQPYANKDNLLENNYWREDFVGLGPFKLSRYERNAFAILDAFDGYVLGRPKVDLIEVKFLADSNVVLANVLAGAIDFAPTRTFSFDAGVEASERWSEGQILFPRGGSNISVYIQFMNPNPAALTNVNFRRGLFSAMNRDELLTLQLNRGSVSHTTVLGPDSWEYEHIEKDIVKYPFDPRRAVELIQSAGLSRGPDGVWLNPSGEKLSLELRTTVSEPETRMVLVMAENWKAVGVPTETYVIPTQQASDREYRALFPGVQLLNQHTNLVNFLSREIPLAENRYVGNNKNRISDPQLDAWINQYFVTIPVPERMQVFGQIIRKMSDEIITMPTIYRASAILVTKRVKGMQGTSNWNIQEWTLG